MTVEDRAALQQVVWCFIDPGPDGVTPDFHFYSEPGILREYFPYWSEQMRKVGKADMISERLCIEDFVVVHWAWKVKDERQEEQRP